MKLSVFTTIKDPHRRGDNYTDAFHNYIDLADEFVVVDGSKSHWGLVTPGDVYVHHYWPKEFKWTFIGKQFQRGYEACTGDWVIHADLDFIFHENDFEKIRQACELYNDYPALTFFKRQFIMPNKYNVKSRLVVAVNKSKYGNRIKFNSGGDLAQPSLDGVYISPNDVPEAGVALYNYEKMTKTEQQIKDDCGRMDRAYFRHFGEYQFKGDGTDETAYEGWLQMVTGRYSKPQAQIKLSDHPKYVQETIRNLKPEQWGYTGFGRYETYV